MKQLIKVSLLVSALICSLVANAGTDQTPSPNVPAGFELAPSKPRLQFRPDALVRFNGESSQAAETLARSLNRLSATHPYNWEGLFTGQQFISGRDLNRLAGEGLFENARISVHDFKSAGGSRDILAAVEKGVELRFVDNDYFNMKNVDRDVADHVANELNRGQSGFPHARPYTAEGLISGGQQIPGHRLNMLKDAGVLAKVGTSVFRKVAVAALVAGAVVGTASAAQAATVRRDMTVGGAPVKLEGSNVGTTSGFESFQSTAVSSRSSATAR